MLSELVSDLRAKHGSTKPVFTAANQPAFTKSASSLQVKLFQNKTIETKDEIAKLKSALRVVSSNVPRGDGTLFNSDGTPAQAYWIGVIWAIASLEWLCGKELALEWSRQSSRYSDEGFEKAWSDFDQNHPNPVGIGSVYKLAQCLGWQSPSCNSPATPSITSGYKLMSASDVLKIPPTHWRVKHLFPDKGLAAIYGPSASGKSFLAFDLGVSIADGQPWFGHKTSACDVVYIVLEGQSGIQNRIRAWMKGRNSTLPDAFCLVLDSVRLNNTDDVRRLAECIPQGAVVFIDTLNRAVPGADENSSKDMGEIIEGAATLAQMTDGLVVLVHHTGKDASQGMRGHSSLFAALDGAIEVKRTVSGRSWTIAKSKDGGDGKSTPFKLAVHDLGFDSDGEQVTSCTVEPDLGSIFVRQPPSHAGPKNALREIASKIASGVGTLTGVKGAPPGVDCLKMDDAVLVVANSLATVLKNKRTNNARRQIQSLTNSGHLGVSVDANGDAWCWIEP
jgi:hypothetical protein